MPTRIVTDLIAFALRLATLTALLITLNRTRNTSSGSARTQPPLFWPISKEKSLGALGPKDRQFGARSAPSRRGGGAPCYPHCGAIQRVIAQSRAPRQQGVAASAAFAPLGPLKRWRAREDIAQVVGRLGGGRARVIGRDDGKVCHGRNPVLRLTMAFEHGVGGKSQCRASIGSIAEEHWSHGLGRG